MCGIVGLVNFNSTQPSRLILQKMTEAIRHRGPDDGGLEITSNCGLGNRRLAVIDLSFNGHQPMWDKNKKFCITFNGEIYNYKELKEQLKKKGYHFFSDSDTEVVLTVYKEYGSAGLKKLRGMFALAIWDVGKQELFLARDHFGIKPLHFFINSRVLVFGSEIKSILLHPEVNKTINPIALSHYFSLGFGCIASPETIFEGIYKLQPGHWAKLRRGKLMIKKYWDLAQVNSRQVCFSEALEKTKNLLENSVRSQLVADVPLGVFLSGGVDSSLITALAQKASNQSLKTFSIGFKDKEFDESRYATLVSDRLHTNHYHHQFSSHDLLETLPKVIEKLDEPFADASIIPTFLLSKFTRQEVTVALSGDGGDELFAGYPTYLGHLVANHVNFLPQKFNSLIKDSILAFSPIFKTLPWFRHAPNLSFEYKINRFFDGMDDNLGRQYLNFMGPTSLESKKQFLLTHQEKALEVVERLLKRVKKRDLLTRLLYLDLMIYLSEDGLVKIDRASSFNSLEIRPPMLNVELAEYVFSLPSQYKIHHLTLKYLLKQIAKEYLPLTIVNRPKKGFGMPVHHWLRTSLRPDLEHLLAKDRLKKQGIFDPIAVNLLVKEHLADKIDHRMLLWNMLIFQFWYDRWFK